MQKEKYSNKTKYFVLLMYMAICFCNAIRNSWKQKSVLKLAKLSSFVKQEIQGYEVTFILGVQKYAEKNKNTIEMKVKAFEYIVK